MASFGNNLVFSRCLMFDEFARFNISEQGLTELPPWVVLGEKKKTFRPAAAAAWCISVSPVGKRNFHIRRCWLASRSMSRGGATKTTKEPQEKGMANVKCEARNGVCRSLESYQTEWNFEDIRMPSLVFAGPHQPRPNTSEAPIFPVKRAIDWTPQDVI